MLHIPATLIYSIVTIVFSFILVNFYSFIQEKRKIKTKLKNNESYTLFWLNKIIKSILKQIDNLNDFHKNLKQWNQIEYISYGKIKFPLNKIQELSSLEIYSTFVLNKKGDKIDRHSNYSRLINGIEFLGRKEDEIGEKINNFSKINREYRLEMRNVHMELEENRIRIFQAGLSNLENDEFLKKYYEHHNCNKSETLKNIHEMYEKYMLPLNKLCTEMLNKYPKDPRISIVQRIVFLFKSAYEGNDIHKKLLENFLSEFIEVLIDYKYKFEKLISYYDNLKFKAIFNLS